MFHVTHLPRRFAALLLGACLACTPLAVNAVFADQSKLTVSGNQYGLTQTVTIEINKSLIIDLPADVSDVIVSQPTVAGAIMRSTRRAIIQGVAAGNTNIIFLDAKGGTISVLDTSIQQAKSNVGNALQETINRVLPSARIGVESVLLSDADGNTTNRIVLSGSAQSTDDVQKAITIAAQFAGGPENVASVVSISGPQQVMLKVTVAEVSRETVKQFGLNLTGSFNAGNGLTTSVVSSQPLGGASNVATNSAITAGLNVGNLSLKAVLQALERRGALRTLAEPTLTAMSGQSAEFLAGGKVPVPTSVDADGRVTFTEKEFGVKLAFTPTVRSNGSVELLVDTSVSEPNPQSTVSIGSVTFTGSNDRQAKTTVELQSGMTLAIGGLMQDQVRQQINQMPGLANIPILGALFRSRDFVHAETELVILVTPYLVEPTQSVALPTDDVAPASDAEAIFMGRLETQYGVGTSNGGMRGSFKGSVGFVLD
ncbi:type II and III secretion system protein family protein [Devosia sp.]|uniref:type II and III secretion system protein family protein n=1 Tax=Devosia sp. TaxID=1871048 RepID=UPI00326311C5